MNAPSAIRAVLKNDFHSFIACFISYFLFILVYSAIIIRDADTSFLFAAFSTSISDIKASAYVMSFADTPDLDRPLSALADFLCRDNLLLWEGDLI